MISQALLNLNSDLRFTINGDIKTDKDYAKIKWIVGKDKTGTASFGMPSSIPTFAEVQAEIKRISPMIEWKNKMRGSDFIMSRDREHAITRMDNGVADNMEEQERYNQKIALRGAKPQDSNSGT